MAMVDLVLFQSIHSLSEMRFRRAFSRGLCCSVLLLSVASSSEASFSSNYTQRRRLSPSDNVSQYLQHEMDNGDFAPRFTLVGTRTSSESTSSDKRRRAQETVEYDINVMVAHPSVTERTSYSVYGGPRQQVQSNIVFLVSDPDADDGTLSTSSNNNNNNNNNGRTSSKKAKFALLAVDKTTHKMHGVAQRHGEKFMRVRQQPHSTGRASGEGMNKRSTDRRPIEDERTTEHIEVQEQPEFNPPPWECGVTAGIVHGVDDVEIDEEGMFGRRRVEANEEQHHHHHHHHHKDHRNLRGGDMHTSLDSLTVNLFDADVVKSKRHRTLYATDSFPYKYTYQVDLYIEIDDVIVENNHGSIEKAIEYINAVITAASAMYEREIDTHLHVAHIALTNLYKSSSNKADALQLMKETYGGSEWHYQGYSDGIDIHHALLGQDFYGGIAYVGSLCNSRIGFGLASGIRGNVDLGVEAFWDVWVASHELGHSFGSMHTHDLEVRGTVSSLAFICRYLY